MMIRLMDFMNYLRTKFAERPSRRPALVEVYHDSTPFPELPPALSHVDFSYTGDLESYVRGLAVPRETIEEWISTGLLFPEEMKMAGKMVQILRRQEKDDAR